MIVAKYMIVVKYMLVAKYMIVANAHSTCVHFLIISLPKTEYW